jgi:anthranilate phosphoribosyltransferase
MKLEEAIARVVDRRDLSADEMAAAVGTIMDGAASPAQIGAFLIALRMKGETIDEIVGAAQAMRLRAQKLNVPEGVLVDTCGTGGDGRGTINVSTLAALVVAAAGVRVAKHGNRAQSSRAGSADVLEALGVNVAASVATVEKCLREVGIGFLFAPAFHGATKNVSGPRKEIAVRTVFNLLGPLTNPAGARRQLVGVFDTTRVKPMAHALGRLGSERAMVVHGDGMDELAPAGTTEVAELRDGKVSRYRLTPADFGLADEDPAGLAGGDAKENAQIARAVLSGERGGAARSCVIMSAAATLYVAGEGDFRDGAQRVARLLDEKKPLALLDRLIEVSRS